MCAFRNSRKTSEDMATAIRLSRVSLIFRKFDNIRRLSQYATPKLFHNNLLSTVNQPSHRFLSTTQLRCEQQQLKPEETGTQGSILLLYSIIL